MNDYFGWRKNDEGKSFYAKVIYGALQRNRRE